MKSTRDLNGYKVIYQPDHPRAMTNKNWLGYVYEHIYVAEESLGRPLRDNEVVHHLNGKREDNRSCNLLVLEKGQHSRLHMWLDNGAPYEGTLRVNALNSGKSKSEEPRSCIVCGKTIQCSANTRCCSVECKNLHKKNINKPSKEELELDISNLSWVSIGKKYGVSDNGARKWAKGYDLI